DEDATVRRTEATEAFIGSGANVGPFTYLRPGTVLGDRGKIGAFYETKNVKIGRGAKLSHLGYAGDAEIGENSNIGCGNITAKYDGINKHRTGIGAEVRTGSKDRKSTRLNSSHVSISYAVFCLEKKNQR